MPGIIETRKSIAFPRGHQTVADTDLLPQIAFSSKVVRHSQTLEVEPCEEFDSQGDLTN